MVSVQELLRGARDLPGDSPARDAEILLGHCLDKPRSWLYTWPEAEVSGEALTCFQQLLQRRYRGEPVAYLTGHREFWSLDLAVAPSTLIPRPETETLVEWALELPLPDDTVALDLGTGTGAIALALANEKPGWRVCGADVNIDAVQLASNNALANNLARVEFIQSDWFDGVEDKLFNLLVSNPPYVEEGDAHLSEGDVRFEPLEALVAADRGLADLDHIVKSSPDYLQTRGWLLLEHGFDQALAVRELLVRRGFKGVETRQDLAGQERITGGQWFAN
ncbi:MAG: peptide chain release factor N(5)-glutamine methyltransferase [Halieaceae bacterium]|jgi:release factor glutamine methyltransferase|nr:peptide chain release factor N(5)-glutamine methyltransferase [Halieaceae bacterium]MBT7721015.1 peptide chain release factor N(5)-glutamine methyltransferase [Halieaceae bacterium]